MNRSGVAWLGILPAGTAMAVAMTAAAGTPRITTAQSDYVEHCAGCHGISGSSAPAPVPELRDRVGYFMCNGEARDYLIRLPNVAHAPIRDSGELADLMNFVVFSIGGKSVPDGAQPYQAEEVARLRAEPLRPGAALLARRRQLVGDLIRTCDAPADLQEFYAGQAPESRERQDSRAGA